MARIPDNQYYQGWDTGTDNPNADGLGANRFLTLEDVVNNYIVLYGDEEMHSGTVKRMKIEAFAQRAVQEFSYEIFRVKDWEYEVLDVARFPMPQDMVELVEINYVDQYGQEHWLVPRRDSSSPRSPLQGIHNEYDATRRTAYPQGAVVYLFDETQMAQERFSYYRAATSNPVAPQTTVTVTGDGGTDYLLTSSPYNGIPVTAFTVVNNESYSVQFFETEGLAADTIRLNQALPVGENLQIRFYTQAQFDSG